MPTQSVPRRFSAGRPGIDGTRVFDVMPTQSVPRRLSAGKPGIDGTRVVDVTPGPRALLGRSPSIDGRRVADVTPELGPGIEVIRVGLWGLFCAHTKTFPKLEEWRNGSW